MQPDELRALAERELAAGNPLASYVLLLDRKLALARLSEESANHRAAAAEAARERLSHQRNDLEFVLACISDALDGVRYQGSPACKILALRAELDAAQSDLAERLEIVGYTTQAEINKTGESTFTPGEFYRVPDGDAPVELLRRVGR